MNYDTLRAMTDEARENALANLTCDDIDDLVADYKKAVDWSYKVNNGRGAGKMDRDEYMKLSGMVFAYDRITAHGKDMTQGAYYMYGYITGALYDRINEIYKRKKEYECKV